MKTEDADALGRYRAKHQARSKPDTVDRPVRTLYTFVHHYNSTEYCSRETVFLIFAFPQTNITSQMWPRGGKEKGGGANLDYMRHIRSNLAMMT